MIRHCLFPLSLKTLSLSAIPRGVRFLVLEITFLQPLINNGFSKICSQWYLNYHVGGIPVHKGHERKRCPFLNCTCGRCQLKDQTRWTETSKRLAFPCSDFSYSQVYFRKFNLIYWQKPKMYQETCCQTGHMYGQWNFTIHYSSGFPVCIDLRPGQCLETRMLVILIGSGHQSQ